MEKKMVPHAHRIADRLRNCCKLRLGLAGLAVLSIVVDRLVTAS
jgi:hypothetical protein